jgi:DNA invertase Pin-like site-specific DNA recombinase
VAFASLHEGIDTSTSTGRLIFHIFAAMAEFERELIAERAAVGRATKLLPEQVRMARAQPA